MKHLSHNHYAVSDREAGRIARTSPGNGGKLPRVGYERDVVLADGRGAVLKRTVLTPSDPVRNKRGWVWTVMPHVVIPPMMTLSEELGVMEVVR